MLEKISLYNESETKNWDRFIESHPKGTPFHLSCWLRAIHKTYSFKPLPYILKNGDGEILGVFPCFSMKGLFEGTRIVSLPYSDYCGPLVKDHNHEKELLETITQENEKQISYIEIRSPLLNDSHFICHDYFKQHILHLSADPAEVKKIIDKRTIQYCIRKAKRVGVTIVEDNTENGVKEFYRLNCLTRKKHGVPAQPKKYFDNIYNEMIQNKMAFLLLAIYDNITIAAGLFFKFKDTIFYKYNASDPQYLIKQAPNHLLTWHAIEQACLNGFEYFDFGRTSPDNNGLMRYKEMWGAKPVELPYYYYPKIRGATSTTESSFHYRILTCIWRSLPNVISEKLGPLIYRYTG